jgi:hypothetical protein
MKTSHSEADRLEAWLEEGPSSAPNDLVDHILREFPTRAQRRTAGWWRTPLRLGAYGMTVAAAVILVLVLTRPSEPRFGDVEATPGWADRFPTQTAAEFTRPFEYAIDPASGLTDGGSDPDPTIYQFRVPDSQPITDSTTFTSGVVVRTAGDGLRMKPCQESGGEVRRHPSAQQFVDYLATVPGLEVSGPLPRVIDGHRALSVEVQVNTTRPCAELWVFEGCGCPFADQAGAPRARRIDALDVDGELILIVSFATNGDLAGLLPTADAFIDTIHFLP